MAGVNDDDTINFEEELLNDMPFPHVDYSESNFSTETALLGDLFSNIAATPNGYMPSSGNSLSSPPQLGCDFDNQLLTDIESGLSDKSYGSSNTSTDPLFNVSGTSVPQIQLNGYELDTLQIIVQPNPTYRPRYESEVDKSKGRAFRFIRSAKDNQQYAYPTVRIPSWCNPKQQLYIQVALVTVTNDRVDRHYIHPYNIYSSDKNVIKDKNKFNNSFYFRINESEYHTREKSFCIMILKKKQDQLQSSGPMHLFDPKPCENISVKNPTDPKEKIKLYELSKSHFVFTIAQRKDGTDDFLFYNPSAISDIMTEETDVTPNSSRNRLNSELIDEIKCIPRKSTWDGGEEVVIIMPYPIKKKKYTIGFHFGEYGIRTTEIDIIEPRTILFRTPACPCQAGDDILRVPILIHENQLPFATIDFCYIPPIKTSINKRSWIREENMSSRFNHKRLKDLEDETDGAEFLVPQMDKLSIDNTDTKLRSNSTSSSSISKNEKLNNLDKRLGEVKLAIENFVRTDDPSGLFRAVRFLLSKYDGTSSPLHDAIQNGHIKIALAVIEQTMDLPSSKNLLKKENENGETPLLIAAKFNRWEIIELILKKRLELGRQKDQDGNNLFHFLANLGEDKGAETIENILRLLPQELKINLLKEKNKQNQSPMDIAQSNGNISSSKLFHNHENNSE